MKTNKLAAGALALALGLGAVAPAQAASTKTETSGMGEVLVTEDYRQAEKVYVEAFQAWKAAVAKEAELKEIRDAKEAAKNEAFDAIDAYYADLEALQDKIDKNAHEGQKILAELEDYLKDSAKDKNWKDITLDDLRDIVKDEKQNDAIANVVDIQGLADRARKLKDEKNDYILQNDINEIRLAADRAQDEYEVAQANYAKAVKATAAAKDAYEKTKRPFIQAGADRNKIGLAEKYGDVSYVTEDKEEEDDEEEVEEDEAAAIAKAEAALEDAKITKKGAEMLLNNYPETVKNVKDQLVKLLEAQEEKIEKLEDALKAIKGEKVALSNILFSTAFAAEDSALDELINATEELEENTQEIKDTLEENEKANAEENKEEENNEEVEEENNEEVEEENNENVEEDDKEEDKKPADKEEDKKPADKEEDKKEDKKDGVKAPAKNAKTGVVGLTGVAGILAAASVAYAASKRK